MKYIIIFAMLICSPCQAYQGGWGILEQVDDVIKENEAEQRQKDLIEIEERRLEQEELDHKPKQYDPYERR